MEIIVPAAGLSTRFPNTKPKYLLYNYDGSMMLERALRPYLNKDHINITIGILREHNEKYDSINFIKRELGEKVNVVVIPDITRGPADTVMQIIDIAQLDNNRPLLVRDCDSYFEHNETIENYVCTTKISNESTALPGKSYVVTNSDNIVQHIIEKQVVSDNYCVGAYKFRAIWLFKEAFLNIEKSLTSEFYVSSIVEYCINNGHVFFSNEVQNYSDVGTLSEWLKFNNRPTLFCDIDGTIIEAQTRWGINNYDDPPIPLKQNIEVIKRYQSNGSKIVFTTSRPNWARDATTRMLHRLGFNNFQLLTGLNNSSRIIINDYNDSNPYPMASAINLKRNSDNLVEFLKLV